MSSPTADSPTLAGAPWLAREEMQAVFQALRKNGHVVRAVGGAVRNSLLGLDVSEVDLATTALPQEIIELAKDAGLKAVPTGIEHGTVTVISGKQPYEVTTLRRDVETFGRKAKVAFTDDWQADASRRDFTMNALYADDDGTIHDPLGGRDDLKQGRVRFIGKARERIREDYLRILRFFRFNARFGKPPFDAEGLSACVQERDGLSRLSAERVRMELLKLIVARGAMEAVRAMFDHGLLVDMLGSAPLLGQLDRMVAIEAECAMPGDAMRRLAALAVVVPEDAERLGERFRLSNKERTALEAAAKWRVFTPLPGEAEAKVLLYRLGRDDYERAVMQAWAHSPAPEGARRGRALAELPARWTSPEFPLRGTDLMDLGFEKGPRMGELLAELETRWIDEGMTAGRDVVLVWAGRMKG